MPLSEHEQRLLEQIEQALYAEDPKFARSWRVRDLRSLQRVRAIRAGLLVLVGLALLVAGVIVQPTATVVGVALGVTGFLLMLAGAWLAMSTRSRTSAPRTAKPTTDAKAGNVGKAGKAGKAGRPRESLKTRLEERWQRRQEDR